MNKEDTTVITELELLEKVINTRFYHHETLTVCVVTVENGFHVVGKSACVDPSFYDKNKGQMLAFDDCIQQLWALEGYVLKETIYWDSKLRDQIDD